MTEITPKTNNKNFEDRYNTKDVSKNFENKQEMSNKISKSDKLSLKSPYLFGDFMESHSPKVSNGLKADYNDNNVQVNFF